MFYGALASEIGRKNADVQDFNSIKSSVQDKHDPTPPGLLAVYLEFSPTKSNDNYINIYNIYYNIYYNILEHIRTKFHKNCIEVRDWWLRLCFLTRYSYVFSMALFFSAGCNCFSLCLKSAAVVHLPGRNGATGRPRMMLLKCSNQWLQSVQNQKPGGSAALHVFSALQSCVAF